MNRKKRSALATIRKATGMTAREFGARCGVSDALIIQMENGKRAISLRVAVAVMALTGADSDLLIKGNARCLRGRPYTRQSFADWCEVGGTEEVVSAVAERAAEMVRALVLASATDSAGNRKPGRFHAVSLKLSVAMDEIATDAGLVDAANLQLASRVTQHEARVVPVKQAQELYGRSPAWPGIAKALGKAAKVEVRESTAPVWTRFAGRVVMQDGSAAWGEAILVNRVKATARIAGSSAREVVVPDFVRSSATVLMRRA